MFKDSFRFVTICWNVEMHGVSRSFRQSKPFLKKRAKIGKKTGQGSNLMNG